MNPIQREPAIAVGIATALVGLMLVYGILNERQAAAWSALLVILAPLIQGWVTRFLVFSPNTLREAGLNPESVKERADDPSVPRNTQGER